MMRLQDGRNGIIKQETNAGDLNKNESLNVIHRRFNEDPCLKDDANMTVQQQMSCLVVDETNVQPHADNVPRVNKSKRERQQNVRYGAEDLSTLSAVTGEIKLLSI